MTPFLESPSRVTPTLNRGGVLNSVFCFLGDMAKNVPRSCRCANFSSFRFKLFCAARFASCLAFRGVDASPSPSMNSVASLMPDAKPVAVLRVAPENVERPAVDAGCRSNNARALALTPPFSPGTPISRNDVRSISRSTPWCVSSSAAKATSSTALRVETRGDLRFKATGMDILWKGRKRRVRG